MMTRIVVMLAATAAFARPAETPDELRELVRKSLTGILKEEERRADFLFRVRNERKELDAAGKVTSSKSYVWERIEIDGFTFGKTLERDGKPLTAEQRKAEDEAIQKRLAELKAPTTAQAAVSSQPKKRSQQEEWYQEFPEALDYRLAGEETIGGRIALRLEATPRPGYQPRNLRARVFEKMKTTIWIDKVSSELVKADAEMFDTVNVGFGLVGRVDKGTRFRLQRRMVNDGVWLIESQTIRFSARFLLFKNLRNEATTEWSNFRLRSKPVASVQGTRP
jgi:hypothetical protein